MSCVTTTLKQPRPFFRWRQTRRATWFNMLIVWQIEQHLLNTYILSAILWSCSDLDKTIVCVLSGCSMNLELTNVCHLRSYIGNQKGLLEPTVIRNKRLIVPPTAELAPREFRRTARKLNGWWAWNFKLEAELMHYAAICLNRGLMPSKGSLVLLFYSFMTVLK